jgi:hypothetical protein
MLAAGMVLFAIGRLPICQCGYVKLWHGAARSAETSQHLTDWYTLTHLSHGFFLYWLLHLLAPGLSLGSRLALATLLEGGWEVLENTDYVINRYRTATISFGYVGDTIVNALGDIAATIVGVLIAGWLPAALTVLLLIGLEVGLAALIRDNLTLNLIMLLYPIDSIKAWQAAG